MQAKLTTVHDLINDYCRTSREEYETNKEETTDSVEYEEIGDAKSSFSYTQNVVYGISTNKLTSNSVPETPVVESQTPNCEMTVYQTIDDAYKVNRCSAYGILSSCDLNTS
jgi:hypothetical protein